METKIIEIISLVFQPYIVAVIIFGVGFWLRIKWEQTIM